MNYFSLRLDHTLSEIESDLLIDELAALGFESFETETEPDAATPSPAEASSSQATPSPAEPFKTLFAYVPEPAYKENIAEIAALLQSYAARIISRTDTLIPDRDWNAVWESQYEAVRFDDFCYVRAPFHQPLPEVRYNIEIEPKMSFGTAHHPTTALMIRFLEMYPAAGERVLDMGCGTGVLGILAAMQGAEKVSGIDIDEWAYKNALENVARNRLTDKVEVAMGDAALLRNRRFDRVIANINRNILIRDMQAYADTLPAGGTLYISGFYRQDMEMLENEANACRLFYQKHLEADDWAAVKFLKK